MELGYFFPVDKQLVIMCNSDVQGFPCPGDVVAILFLLLERKAASYTE